MISAQQAFERDARLFILRAEYALDTGPVTSFDGAPEDH